MRGFRSEPLPSYEERLYDNESARAEAERSIAAPAVDDPEFIDRLKLTLMQHAAVCLARAEDTTGYWATDVCALEAAELHQAAKALS